MSRKTKNPKETLNRYNALVRQAMSNKYVECAKRRGELYREGFIIYNRLEKEQDTLSYRQYMELKAELEQVRQQEHDEIVKRDIWDQAREICIECADEVFGGEFERFIDIWNGIPEEIRVSEKELKDLLIKGKEN